ncbi:Conserved hypothetical protein [Micromonospora lupini str. Lupac 08]|uniref:Uncharacterized protein n=1 Tax=Micromonospora lupini str. Lupac 08 TaxID=1150864 RepID=I0KX83_9ACTN|nr:Conserved hypothetical protein [Micromonospora lupini str. Lupac 08]
MPGAAQLVPCRRTRRRSPDGGGLQPRQGRPVVGDGELQRAGVVRLAVPFGVLDLFAYLSEGLGVVFVGRGVQALELAGRVQVAEGHPQRYRVADGVPPRVLRQPAGKCPFPARRERVRLAHAGARLAEPHVTPLGQHRQLTVDLTAGHRPVRRQTALSGGHQLTACHRALVEEPEKGRRRRVDSGFRHARYAATLRCRRPGFGSLPPDRTSYVHCRRQTVR